MPLQIAPCLLYYLWKIRKSQRLSPSELEELQNRKLRAIVKHAYEKVPYYHKLFSSVNINPDDIKTREDLVKVPITTKKVLQKLPISEHVAKGVDITKCIKMRTGGSTGQPLDLFLNRRELSYRIAMQTRAYGLSLTNRKANILNPLTFPRKGSYFRILRKCLNYLGLWKRYYLSFFKEPQELVSKLLKIKPDVIETHPSIMRLMAEFVRKENITGITPKLIFTRAELLTTKDRKKINGVFGAELIDLYGTAEFGILAWECNKHQGYHINSDIVMVEAVKDKQQVYEEAGKILCTDLTNYTMPFIRYALGDIVVLSKRKCGCGNNFPLIKSIEGRSDDFLSLPMGKLLSPVPLRVKLEEINGIDQYKLIQENINTFNVQIIKGQAFKEATIEEFENVLREILGRDIKVNINIVDEIPREKSGKIRPIVSKVPINL